jgi:hypothetical protein
LGRAAAGRLLLQRVQHPSPRMDRVL